MTNKTFTFNIEQIKEIFRAGISRGAEEEASFQCGSRTTGNQFDNCVAVIHDIINEGKDWREEGYVNFFEVDSWFK
jgi:hypothetical protein